MNSSFTESGARKLMPEGKKKKSKRPGQPEPGQQAACGPNSFSSQILFPCGTSEAVLPSAASGNILKPLSISVTYGNRLSPPLGSKDSLKLVWCRPCVSSMVTINHVSLFKHKFKGNKVETSVPWYISPPSQGLGARGSDK